MQMQEPLSFDSLLKIADTTLDLLNIDEEGKQGYLYICHEILEKKLPLLSFHKMGFFFESFYEKKKKKIELQDFIAVGDVTSSRTIFHSDRVSSFEFLTQKTDVLDTLQNQTLVICDKLSFLWLSEGEQEVIEKKLKKSDSLLLLA